MVKLRCYCGYEWDYQGKSDLYVSCPRCRGSNSKKRARQRYLEAHRRK